MQEAKTKRLAEVLNEARWKKEYTYQKVAELTGINYSNVWGAMNGEILPRETNLRKLATVLDLDGDELVEVRARESKKSTRARVSPEKRAHYSIYDNLTKTTVIERGTVEECAAALGMSPGSFATLMSRQRKPEKYKYYKSDKRWKISKINGRGGNKNETERTA